MLEMAAQSDNAEPLSELQGSFAQMRRRTRSGATRSFSERRGSLRQMTQILLENESEIVDAVRDDFGWRSPDETRFADIAIVQSAISDAVKNLKKWMRPERVAMPLHHMPAKGQVVRMPLGVVGVIGPWNYPIQLSLVPVVNALAAGNRVLLKPSELAPRTSAVLKRIINASFDHEVLRVHTGDRDFAAQFSGLPFDHLFFTGSTAVGRKIAAAAAPNLTPVTLELGGKSPAIVSESASISDAADAIVWGKCLNAGQTCIAPDYVLVSRFRQDELIEAMQVAFRRRYPRWWASGEYSAIVSGAHRQRLEDHVTDARSRGIAVMPLGDAIPKGELALSDRLMRPLLLIDADPGSSAMQDELFGPILPVIGVEDLSEAVEFVAQRPRPLALYLFSSEQSDVAKIQNRIVAGGMIHNDVIWHVAVEGMPFGGVGESGTGDYHGEAGFLTFTKRMPLYRQSRFTGTKTMRPPYDHAFRLISKFLQWRHAVR